MIVLRFEIAAIAILRFGHLRHIGTGEMKASTSTVAALFSKVALTGQIIAVVDMGFASFSSISTSTVGLDVARVSL